MNYLYSNLIYGHNTTPREIERALAGELAGEEDRRALQVEAAAHIRLQREIDRLHAEGMLPEPASCNFIRWLHREPEAYRLLDETLLRGELPRGEAARATGLRERTARELLASLVEDAQEPLPGGGDAAGGHSSGEADFPGRGFGGDGKSGPQIVRLNAASRFA